jgi:hypothetical protein
LGKTLLSCGIRQVFEHEKKASIGTIISAILKIEGDSHFEEHFFKLMGKMALSLSNF